jgi:hypothetical protein
VWRAVASPGASTAVGQPGSAFRRRAPACDAGPAGGPATSLRPVGANPGHASGAPNRAADPGWRVASSVIAETGSENAQPAAGWAFNGVVAKGGIEPPTRGFSIRCSTN